MATAELVAQLQLPCGSRSNVASRQHAPEWMAEDGHMCSSGQIDAWPSSFHFRRGSECRTRPLEASGFLFGSSFAASKKPVSLERVNPETLQNIEDELMAESKEKGDGRLGLKDMDDPLDGTAETDQETMLAKVTPRNPAVGEKTPLRPPTRGDAEPQRPLGHLRPSQELEKPAFVGMDAAVGGTRGKGSGNAGAKALVGQAATGVASGLLQTGQEEWKESKLGALLRFRPGRPHGLYRPTSHIFGDLGALAESASALSGKGVTASDGSPTADKIAKEAGDNPALSDELRENALLLRKQEETLPGDRAQRDSRFDFDGPVSRKGCERMVCLLAR
eukprot:TRINITY_DN34481_c0_g1_i3.p1 TRINITY_DN34481_c0_g1~~TRINITY_DN34481_c0_g1_i3.p1  ORF type:complete len:334 (-),score=34.81 TRINITY_DN34481_c0_g1_i3:37-1038(-)